MLSTTPQVDASVLISDTSDMHPHGVAQADWRLDARLRRLTLGGQPVALGDRAFDLLRVLAETPGRLIPTETLLDAVWPDRVVGDNNLHVHMAALRRVLGDDAIRTVRGQGYQLISVIGLHGTAAEPAGAPPLPTAAVPAAEPAGNLSRRVASLIGRGDDLLHLLSLLHQHRGVTLTGPAGVGKTTLAKSAVQALAGADMVPAVWLVELAGVAEGAPVAEVVARTLGITLPGLQHPHRELIDLLRRRQLLLLLDNCEHRAGEVAQLTAALIESTAGVRVLATSQASLRYAGEQLFRLAPLSLPPPGASSDETWSSGAVQLFRARLAERSFTAALQADERESLGDVVAICRGLDGLPLALELAAARVPLLGLAAVRARLAAQLKLLGGAQREAPARHQTLRAAIQWSHALLSDDERIVLRRLAVFAGSFTMALAQQVVSDAVTDDAADGADDDWASIDLLQGLLDKSLIVPHGDDAAGRPPRLRLLESTRHFAQERLLESGESARMQLRLAHAMLRHFGRGDGPRDAPPNADDAEARAPDLDNLRAALDALSAQPAHATRLIALTGASAWIWSRLGLRAEGQRRCRLALDRVDASTPPADEARLQLAWLALTRRRGAAGEMASAVRAAALYAGLGDRLGRFRALSSLSYLLAFEGNESACEAALEEMAESFDPGWGVMQWGAYQTTVCACLAQFDRWDEVTATLTDAMRRVSVRVSSSVMAFGWAGSAQVHSAMGDNETAVMHGQTAVSMLRNQSEKGQLGMALGDLASYLAMLGRVDEALPLAREAVLLRSIDGSLGMMLDQLAHLACTLGRMQEAALALGCADAHHARRNGRRDRYLVEPMRLAHAAAAAALPADELAALRARGAAMGDDEVARLTMPD